MKFVSVALLLLALAAADNWAVLVAGSDGFWNYRHQADVSHAYQIMKRGGIPADHIITMMYNDVANDEFNPFPGELYNHPGDDSPNVYEGVIVDYQGDDVTPENFMKVLLGDDSTGKKVLKSNENDNIFLFFSDHGGPDVLCFPSEDLDKEDFQSTLKKMHDKKMFKHFVLYIEACYSGSMGLGFPEDLGISIVTAANEAESSWGWYCGDEAVVKGKDIGSCLGDEFSVFWMEDTDKGEQRTETLNEQWKRIHNGVKMSHASRYGDTTFESDLIGLYVGFPEEKFNYDHQSSVAWDSRDAKFLFLLHKYQRTQGSEKAKWEKLYLEELSLRQQIDRYINSFAKESKLYSAKVNGEINRECYKAAIDQMVAIFGRNDYQYKYYNVLANMCVENPRAFHN